MNLWKTTALAAAVTVSLCAPAFAEDAANLYDLSTQGTSSQLKAGEKGTLVIAITPKNGAHVSDEAPLKIVLSGQNVKPEKTKLTHADSVSKKAEGQQYAAPRFEVPLVAEAAGQGKVEAKMTFFICTEQICSRQQKTLSVPVEVK